MNDLETRHGALPRHTRELVSFVDYCREHPELRFWQALRDWSGYRAVKVDSYEDDNMYLRDTFYWEGRRHDEPAAEAPTEYYALTVAEVQLANVIAFPRSILTLPKWAQGLIATMIGTMRQAQHRERLAHSLLNSGRSWHTIKCPENADKPYGLWFLDRDQPLRACVLNPGDELVVIRAPKVDN